MNPARKMLIGGALVATTITGGALGAALLGGSASAATAAPTATSGSSTSPTAGSAVPTAPPASFDPTKGGHVGANGVKEVLLSGDTATQARAAALAAVPGGTIQRVETDAEGAVYEAHMLKADGTPVTVKLDAGFKVTAIETGGPGGPPGPGGGPGGRPGGPAPALQPAA